MIGGRLMWQQWLTISAGAIAVLGILVTVIGLGLAALQWGAGAAMDRSPLPPATVTQIVSENAAVIPIYFTLATLGGVVLIIGLVLSLLAWLLRRGDRATHMSA